MFNLFSQRQGIEEGVSLGVQEMTLDVQNRLWNKVASYLNDHFGIRNRNKALEYLWDRFFKEDVDSLEINYQFDSRNYRIDQIKSKFFLSEWHKVYDFLEFLLSIDNDYRSDFIATINKVFIDEKVPYKIINNCVTPLVSGEEAREVKIAMDNKYSAVSGHIKKALELYKKRPVADYKNSIKESISSIEALARIILEKPSGTLGSLVQKLDIHPTFKKAIKELYGWTSDEGGIRHAENGKQLKADAPEARFMLIECSALTNYIMSKYEK